MAGTGGDAKLYASTYGVMVGHHLALLKSVKPDAVIQQAAH